MEEALPAHPYGPDVRELTELMFDSAPEDVLTALTAADRLAQRLADLRWPTALAALRRGANLADVAAALGEDDVEWIAIALTAWVDQEFHEGHLDRVGRERLLRPLPTTA